MSRITDESYVTLATNDNYVIGALTLAQSLRNSNTNRSLTVLITNGVSFALQYNNEKIIIIIFKIF